MDPQEIRSMVVEDLSLGNLPPEMQDKVIDQFTENVLHRITIAVLEKMPEEARSEFDRLSEAGDVSSISKLFEANIPDLEDFIRAEVKDEVDRFKAFQASSDSKK